MKKQITKTPKRWPYIAALTLVFGLSALLRLAEVIGPQRPAYSTHPLDDDSLTRLVTIQKTFNKLAQPPRLPIALGSVNPPSLRYLVLIDAGDKSDAGEVRQQLDYFEETMQAAAPTDEIMINQAGLTVPILMYHRTPADFEVQINHLVNHGYTGITLNQLQMALTIGAVLPAKPVIITLDDGYADQLEEVAILRKYNMKATMFIINGGEASKYCIGANTKPSLLCEPYLTWEQIRGLDAEGLITIGSHTSNHPNLAGLTAEQQRAEIFGGKEELEKQLGHSVYDLAYPYGAFNDVSVQLARQAGFRTAVTTEPGSAHTAASLFTLTRLRDSLQLP